MRRGFVVIVIAGACLAACSSSSKSDTSATTIAPNNVPLSTAPATPLAISAYIRSVDLPGHTITVDPIAFLTGPAAKTAYQRANPGATDGPPNDYFISNPKKDSVEMKLAPTAAVLLVHVGGTDHVPPVPVRPSSLVGYPSLTTRPFELRATNGVVNTIVERFVP